MNGKKWTLASVGGLALATVITVGVADVMDKKWFLWSWEAEAQHMKLAGEIKQAGEVAYENKLKILYDRYDGNLVRKDACMAEAKDCSGIIQRVRDLQQEIDKTEKAMEKFQN